MRARIYIALYALGIFLFQEAVFRLVFPLPDAPGLNRMQYMPLGIARIDRHATAVRNIRCRVRSTPDHAEFVNSLNFYGFRGANWPGTAPHGRQRVLFFGDSFIEGHMSPDTHHSGVVRTGSKGSRNGSRRAQLRHRRRRTA